MLVGRMWVEDSVRVVVAGWSLEVIVVYPFWRLGLPCADPIATARNEDSRRAVCVRA